MSDNKQLAIPVGPRGFHGANTRADLRIELVQAIVNVCQHEYFTSLDRPLPPAAILRALDYAALLLDDNEELADR